MHPSPNQPQPTQSKPQTASQPKPKPTIIQKQPVTQDAQPKLTNPPQP